MINADRLRELVCYEPLTGAFSRRVNTGYRGCHKAGSLLHAKKPHGYVKFSVDGREYYGHRLAWLYIHGEWPNGLIDHINGIRDDNRIDNLRVVDNSVNLQNRHRATVASKTGVLGVSFCNYRKKYVAQIVANGLWSGKRFSSLEEATAFYTSMKAVVHGAAKGSCSTDGLV